MLRYRSESERALEENAMGPIAVRHAEARDLDAIRAIYAEPQAQQATLQLPHPPLRIWEERFRALDELNLWLVALEGDQLVGQIGVHVSARPRRRHVAEIGVGVAKFARRRGIGSLLLGEAITLAERSMQVLRIEADVYTDNLGAIALYEKFGFVSEGTSTGYAFRDGQYVDVYRMARLKS
jgi:L-phenylalanine/L-methionine N-acetyltransferase